MSIKSNSIKMKRPDGDFVVVPAANREYYEAKGFKDMGPAPDPGTSEAAEAEEAKPATSTRR